MFATSSVESESLVGAQPGLVSGSTGLLAANTGATATRGDYCSGRAVRGLLFGQGISVLVAGTGIFSQYLARRKVYAPTTQSLLNYLLLACLLVYLYVKRGTFWKTKVPWWRYALLAVADVEANYFVVKAYQYTSITSVMLIDCFTIPCVMVISCLYLGTKYSVRHFVGVFLCLVGLGVLVASDALNASNGSDAAVPHAVYGDLLCMLGSFFYAVSNVGQEAIVKQHDRVEYLGMIGAFGSVISLCQLLVLERTEWASGELNNAGVWALIAGFVVCLFAMYNTTSIFLKHRDSALFNLSLLTSDIWGLLAGMVLFGQHLGWLYFVAYIVIIGGLVVYNGEVVKSALSTQDSAEGHNTDVPKGEGGTTLDPASDKAVGSRSYTTCVSEEIGVPQPSVLPSVC